jgi:hypothetical protein
MNTTNLGEFLTNLERLAQAYVGWRTAYDAGGTTAARCAFVHETNNATGMCDKSHCVGPKSPNFLPGSGWSYSIDPLWVLPLTSGGVHSSARGVGHTGSTRRRTS